MEPKQQQSNEGTPSCVAEVRRACVETFNGLSKKTNQRQTFHKLTVGAEVVPSGMPIILSQFLPDGATAENTVVPFVRGDVVWFELTSLASKGGVTQATFRGARILTPSRERAGKS